MGKIASLACAALLSASLGACAGQATSSTNTTTQSEQTEASGISGQTAGVPNPVTTYSSLQEAEDKAGFALSAPEAFNGLSTKTINVISSGESILEVTLGEGTGTTDAETSSSSEITIRKAPAGTDGITDISGVYTTYPNKSTEASSGVEVSLASTEDKVSLATWSANSFNYSVFCEAGLSKTDMMSLVAQVS